MVRLKYTSHEFDLKLFKLSQMTKTETLNDDGEEDEIGSRLHAWLGRRLHQSISA